jgi:hypothetical protein
VLRNRVSRVAGGCGAEVDESGEISNDVVVVVVVVVARQ